DEPWLLEARGPSASGNYSNTGTATAAVTASAGHTRSTTASDDSSYYGETPQIAINKVTVDGSTSGDGLNILSGEPITWRYSVTKIGRASCRGGTVTDSVAGANPAYVSGDRNSNNKLDTNQAWISEASGTSVSGNYSNTGTPTGSVTDSAGHTRSSTASDDSSYYGETPQIAINKVTVDGSTSGDGLNILSGESITWRYSVT